MEKYSEGVIVNLLILNCPPTHSPRIPDFIIYLLVKSMFSIFTLAIKFDWLVLAIFQSFY